MHIATNSSKIDISEEGETAKIAKKFSTYLKKGDIIFLYGEIGVGKTTFVRYLINNIQRVNKLKLTEILSPTFSIVNEYKVNNFIINHYDLFRLKDNNEIKNIGIFDNLEEVITLIEWPEKIENKPKKLIEVFFNYSDLLDKRFIQIKGLKV